MVGHIISCIMHSFQIDNAQTVNEDDKNAVIIFTILRINVFLKLAVFSTQIRVLLLSMVAAFA